MNYSNDATYYCSKNIKNLFKIIPQEIEKHLIENMEKRM